MMVMGATLQCPSSPLAAAGSTDTDNASRIILLITTKRYRSSVSVWATGVCVCVCLYFRRGAESLMVEATGLPCAIIT